MEEDLLILKGNKVEHGEEVLAFLMQHVVVRRLNSFIAI